MQLNGDTRSTNITTVIAIRLETSGKNSLIQAQLKRDIIYRKTWHGSFFLPASVRRLSTYSIRMKLKGNRKYCKINNWFVFLHIFVECLVGSCVVQIRKETIGNGKMYNFRCFMIPYSLFNQGIRKRGVKIGL